MRVIHYTLGEVGVLPFCHGEEDRAPSLDVDEGAIAELHGAGDHGVHVSKRLCVASHVVGRTNV
jgi:hypothetical protein